MRLLIVLLVACGGSQKTAPPVDPRDNEITALWTQIRTWRAEVPKMGLEPTAQDVLQFGKLPFDELKLVCPDTHHVPQTCNDVCNLSDDICDNAERICHLADELGKGDEYAQEKCSNAKASCKEAKQKCCECSTAADAGSASFFGGSP